MAHFEWMEACYICNVLLEEIGNIKGIWMVSEACNNFKITVANSDMHNTYIIEKFTRYLEPSGHFILILYVDVS